MSEQITFEHPLNEKCRTLLRLSHLFEQFEFHLPNENEWSSRAALMALLDIANILARADIKSDLIKEMGRYAMALSRMADRPGVDGVRLEQILHDINTLSGTLNTINGQLAQGLRTNDFLGGIVQRSSIPGGSFDFDLPELHYWLQLPHGERVMQLDDWRHEIAPVQETVDLLLSLIRHSTTGVSETARNGFYQKNLDAQLGAQMIRVTLPKVVKLFAEISGGKHRYSIRFMRCDNLEQPIQSQEDIDFLLTTCHL